MGEKTQAFTLADNQWKINFEIKQQINEKPDEDDEEEEKSEFIPVYETAIVQFEILKVPEREEMFFVNFKRKAGAAMLYYGAAKLYCDSLALFNNATLEDGETQ